MNRSIVSLFFTMLVMTSFAQFEYGTPLVEGSMTLRIEVEEEEFCGDVMREKSKRIDSYSTNLKGQIYTSLEDLDLMKMFPPKNGWVGTRFYLNNYSQTLPEGATVYDGKNYNIPKYPVIGQFETEKYGKDPCDNTFECDPDYKIILNETSSGFGSATAHGMPNGNFRVSLVGIENCNRYLFLSFNAAGTFIENGSAENAVIKGERSEMIAYYPDDKCERKWEKHETKQMLAVDINPQEDHFMSTDDGSGAWIGSDGYYRRYERETDADVGKYELQEELSLMKIDTAVFIRFMREKPAMQTFASSGYYISTYDDGYKKIVRKVRWSATVVIGKKPGFTIEAENEDEYKKWLPGHPDYAETQSTISIKASFDEGGQEKDSVRFEIIKTSRLPGISTNYPLPADKPPKELADVYFAPQDKQSDPNIKILNDSTAITTQKVKTATVVLCTRDFGAHAQVQAVSMTNFERALCPYDNKNRMLVPYDMNANCMADQWEKDMGIEGADKLEDKDQLPAGQGREGDGLSVFEEYRGFICESDVVASCDADHTLRSGKLVRTSPLCRDVFVFDADGLFARHVAGDNPAECHWHYVNREQLKLPPQDQVASVVKASESDDQNAAANATLATWIKKEYRRINPNSPDTLRNNLQFAMYVLQSPHNTSAGGVTVCYGETKPGQPSPLRYAHLVVLPQYEVMKQKMMGVMAGLMLNTTHKALWDKYPLAVQQQVIQIAFDAMVPHEVGHGLGIDHHTKGSLTVKNTVTGQTMVLDAGTLSKLDTVQYNEVFYFDKQEYLITGPENAFIALGVVNCCMRYTVEREVDFVEMKVLKPSKQYCRKGQTFTDGNGNKVESDNCFGKIMIRCVD